VVGLLFLFPTPSYEAQPVEVIIPKVKHLDLHPRDYAYVLVAKMWGERAEYACLSKLWGKESAWNPRAANPKSTAFGIPQFLDSTWKNYGYPVRPKNPMVQIEAGLKYITARYDTPCRAWKFWERNKWY
jgi:hypothetical protein